MYLFETPFFRTTIRRTLNLPESWYEQMARSYYRAIFPPSVEKAALIITSSEFTKCELEKEFGQKPSFGKKVRVIYPAQEDCFHPPADSAVRSEIRKQISGGGHYLLHLTAGDLRDNTGTALKAFQMARKKLPNDLKLVIVGNAGRVDGGTGDDGVLRYPFVTDDELVRLYQGAAAYLEPSLYEGFGLQFLEAMACGTPVIGPNTTAVPEVVGGAGILVDPERADQLAEAVVRIASNPALQEELTQKSIKQASLFNWNETSRKIAESFEEVLQSLKRTPFSACSIR